MHGDADTKDSDRHPINRPNYLGRRYKRDISSLGFGQPRRAIAYCLVPFDGFELYLAIRGS